MCSYSWFSAGGEDCAGRYILGLVDRLGQQTRSFGGDDLKQEKHRSGSDGNTLLPIAKHCISLSGFPAFPDLGLHLPPTMTLRLRLLLHVYIEVVFERNLRTCPPVVGELILVVSY